MRIIDTNVLVALIVDDRPEQRAAALTWAARMSSGYGVDQQDAR